MTSPGPPLGVLLEENFMYSKQNTLYWIAFLFLLSSCGSDAPSPAGPGLAKSSNQTAENFYFSSPQISQTELDCQEIRIEVRVPEQTDLTLALSASAGKIFTDSTCSKESAQLQIPQAQTSETFYFMSEQLGDTNLVASHVEKNKTSEASSLITVLPAFAVLGFQTASTLREYTGTR